MERLQKIVTLSCLIYTLYGLSSFFQLGTFVPPIPLKPFLFLTFLIAYLVSSSFKEFNLLKIFTSFWLLSLIFVGQYFVEVFFDYQTVECYLRNVEPLVLIGSVLGFISVIFKLSYTIGLGFFKSAIPVLGIVLLFSFSPNLDDHLVYDFVIIAFAFIFYLYDCLNQVGIVETKQKEIILLLQGVAVLTFIERMTYIVLAY
ncbi:hypothetical protein [Brumimicrobium aurantiacum]|uniref:Lysoplasmalogenase n=1 Tax=Brumimicrobium aurantiacum TaxID=1737063 RepID=A0A3E1EUJ2_9FLAO|nr:hypothetical protein [Brumimicrobium aurantiacum]RFC53239.1 hypothetical protein DXU93_14320 [Brumimicrobium aurantiacum]